MSTHWPGVQSNATDVPRSNSPEVLHRHGTDNDSSSRSNVPDAKIPSSYMPVPQGMRAESTRGRPDGHLWRGVSPIRWPPPPPPNIPPPSSERPLRDLSPQLKHANLPPPPRLSPSPALAHASLYQPLFPPGRGPLPILDRESLVMDYMSEEPSDSDEEELPMEDNGTHYNQLTRAIERKLRQLIRDKARKREEVVRLRRTRDNLDNEFLQSLRRQVVSKSRNAVIPVDQLNEKLVELQSIRDECNAAESAYDKLDALIEAAKRDLAILGQHIPRFPSPQASGVGPWIPPPPPPSMMPSMVRSMTPPVTVVAPRHVDPREPKGPLFFVPRREERPVELSGISPDRDEDIHFLYQDLLDAAGDRQLVKEEVEDLALRRDKILYDLELELHRKRVRENQGSQVSENDLLELRLALSQPPSSVEEFQTRFGIDIAEDNLDFLHQFESEMKLAQEKLEKITKVVDQLRELCLRKNVMRKHRSYHEDLCIFSSLPGWSPSPNDGNIPIESFERPTTNSAVKQPPSLANPRFPILLSNPAHVLELRTPRQALEYAERLPKNNPQNAAIYARCMKEVGISEHMSKAYGTRDFVNEWLIHRLRTEPLEAELMLSVAEQFFHIVNLRRWEEDVLRYWRLDGTGARSRGAATSAGGVAGSIPGEDKVLRDLRIGNLARKHSSLSMNPVGVPVPAPPPKPVPDIGPGGSTTPSLTDSRASSWVSSADGAKGNSAAGTLRGVDGTTIIGENATATGKAVEPRSGKKEEVEMPASVVKESEALPSFPAPAEKGEKTMIPPPPDVKEKDLPPPGSSAAEKEERNMPSPLPPPPPPPPAKEEIPPPGGSAADKEETEIFQSSPPPPAKENEVPPPVGAALEKEESKTLAPLPPLAQDELTPPGGSAAEKEGSNLLPHPPPPPPPLPPAKESDVSSPVDADKEEGKILYLPPLPPAKEGEIVPPVDPAAGREESNILPSPPPLPSVKESEIPPLSGDPAQKEDSTIPPPAHALETHPAPPATAKEDLPEPPPPPGPALATAKDEREILAPPPPLPPAATNPTKEEDKHPPPASSAAGPETENAPSPAAARTENEITIPPSVSTLAKEDGSQIPPPLANNGGSEQVDRKVEEKPA
jgi:hypothetical protein